jgi:hypothetical protein
MRVSRPLGNCRLWFSCLFFLFLNSFSLTGVCAPSSSGSYVAAFRTPRHVMISKPEVFHVVVREIVRYLEDKRVDLVSDPLRPRIETQDAISTQSLVKIAKDAGASYLIYIIVDRPIARWLKVTLRCYSLDQKLLWQESAGYTGAFDVNSKKAVPVIMKRLGKELAPRFDHPGLALKKDFSASQPLAKGSPTL